MGAAAIGVALWRHLMRYNPKNPDWFNRDRFILSAGHACLWQYIHLHLSGYDAWTLNALKQYHNPEFGVRFSTLLIESISLPSSTQIAAGHPEIEFPGIELTTGLLGQGIANAVGLAIASKHLAATYNRPNFDIVNNKIWCFTGDGCLQEGVGQEALSVAGHLRLDNLIVIYDDNSVRLDPLHPISLLFRRIPSLWSLSMVISTSASRTIHRRKWQQWASMSLKSMMGR